MRFQRIHEAVYFRPWFITTGGYASVRDLLNEAKSGKIDTKSDFFSDFIRVRPEMTFDVVSGIATISVFGILGQHLTNIEKSCGNTGYEQIISEIGQAKAMGAKGILYNFDTPGGSCLGSDECAQEMANTGLPTVAFTDSLMCSSGYYLAAGADRIIATQTAIVGNIGVICPWVDSSKMWSLEGLDFQPITNEGADLKSTMHGPSLEDSQQRFIQDDVNRAAELFHFHVMTHRESIKPEVWRAGWYSGKQAEDLGLIDAVGSMEIAMGELMAQL